MMHMPRKNLYVLAAEQWVRRIRPEPMATRHLYVSHAPAIFASRNWTLIHSLLLQNACEAYIPVSVEILCRLRDVLPASSAGN